MTTCNQLLPYVKVFGAFKKHWYALKGEDSRDAQPMGAILSMTEEKPEDLTTGRERGREKAEA